MQLLKAESVLSLVYSLILNSISSGMTDSYRGDSCGSFEFLTKSRRASSGRGLESEEDEEEDNRLFFPQRNEEKEAILR